MLGHFSTLSMKGLMRDQVLLRVTWLIKKKRVLFELWEPFAHLALYVQRIPISFVFIMFVIQQLSLYVLVATAFMFISNANYCFCIFIALWLKYQICWKNSLRMISSYLIKFTALVIKSLQFLSTSFSTSQ